MHPDYFNTRFEVEEVVEWPGEFVIISAHATTGEQWTPEQNEEADRKLYEALDGLNVWWESVTGYAPDTGHAEHGYAAQLSLDVASELGRRFRQDAIFHVQGDLLSVTRCDNRRELVPIGSFRERIDVYDPDKYWRLSREPDSPWRLLTSENLAAVLDRTLRLDPDHALAAGEVFVPVAELSLHRALVAAMPDEPSRKEAQDDLDAGSDVDIQRLSRTFTEIYDGGWVVRCEVSSGMTGGVWGLVQFTIGTRGYLYFQPGSSEGLEDWSPVLAGAWSPADDAQAFRACILSAYARLWDSEGFPPLLGEWVAGDPETLHRAVLSALDSAKGRTFWSEVLAHIREANRTDLPIATCLRLGAMSGVPSPWIERAAKFLDDPLSGLAERASAGEASDEEREALAALYLASVMQESRELLERRPGQWLGPVEQLLGTWLVSYGDQEGVVGDEAAGTVVLRQDGSFTWDPPPKWLAASGEWGIELLENGAPKLRFQGGGLRWANYVVMMHHPKGYGTSFYWQRSRWDAVLFKDIILQGYLAHRWTRDMTDDS